MSRAPYTFKQTDVTRAVKAVVAAGIEVQRVEVEKDKIVVIAGKPGSNHAPNQWDDAIKGLQQ
jgi:hypothetical protein